MSVHCGRGAECPEKNTQECLNSLYAEKVLHSAPWRLLVFHTSEARPAMCGLEKVHHNQGQPHNHHQMAGAAGPCV